MATGAERKQAFFTKLAKLLEDYSRIIIVGADNVGSNQMQRIRKSMRGKAVLLMGKNTMVRKAIRGCAESNPKLQVLLPYVRGNVGFIFANEDLPALKKIITENRVAAPAKTGSIAPNDVTIPNGPTGLEPTQTSFLQALNIASKISKGQVDIINDVKLITTGQKVGSSEATLLAKLNIKPFSYGLTINTIYDEGSIYDPSVLDKTDADILAKFQSGVANIASISLALHYPTVAALPHVVGRGFKNCLAVGLATEYSFKQADKMKEVLKNPSAFAAAPAPAKQDEKKPGKAEEKKPAKVVVEEPAEDEDMGFGLFD